MKDYLKNYLIFVLGLQIALFIIAIYVDGWEIKRETFDFLNYSTKDWYITTTIHQYGFVLFTSLYLIVYCIKLVSKKKNRRERGV